MEIAITKLSDERHAVQITRDDKSHDRVEMDSRSFLRHDFAHFAVEVEVPLRFGYWGSVAGGAPLSGPIDGAEIWLAESLAGRVQTLMRVDADIEKYLEVVNAMVPELASEDLAGRIRERIRQLRGHWKSTPNSGDMRIVWSPSTCSTSGQGAFVA